MRALLSFRFVAAVAGIFVLLLMVRSVTAGDEGDQAAANTSTNPVSRVIDLAERLENCLAFLYEAGSTAISPERLRLVAIADGVLVLHFFHRDPRERLATAHVGRGPVDVLHVVENAALAEHLVEKLQEARQLWPRAGNVVVVHVEHAEELHERLAITSCQSGHYRVGPLLHGVQRVQGSSAHLWWQPPVMGLDHQDLGGRAEQADVPAAWSGLAFEARLDESHVAEHALEASTHTATALDDFRLARL